MTVIHATDPTTQVLSLLYQQREDVKLCITERNTSSDVQRAIRADDVIMMLGHGNEYGLFSKSSCETRLASVFGAMPTSLQRSTNFMDCSPA